MSFEKLQSIWDSQQLPDGSLDEEALLKTMQNRDRSFSRVVSITEIVMTAVMLFVTAMFFRDPLLQGHDRVLMIPGVACLIAAALVWKTRLDRRKREMNYQNSLLGLIEKSIDGIGERVSKMKCLVWWFGCPMRLGLVIALFIVDDAKRHLFYYIFIPAFLACMALTYWQVHREIRILLLPEKKQLEELRSQLQNTD